MPSIVETQSLLPPVGVLHGEHVLNSGIFDKPAMPSVVGGRGAGAGVGAGPSTITTSSMRAGQQPNAPARSFGSLANPLQDTSFVPAMGLADVEPVSNMFTQYSEKPRV